MHESSHAGRASGSTRFWKIPRSIRSLPTESAASTALLVPLVFQEKAIGVVSVFNKNGPDPRFTDDDLRLAEAFADARRARHSSLGTGGA